MGAAGLLPLVAALAGQPGARAEPVPPPPPADWERIIAAPPADAEGDGDPAADPNADPAADPTDSIDGRRRPGYNAPLPDRVVQDNPGALRAPPPTAFPTDQVPLPDRWRLVESLGLVRENRLDPYNQNVLKGDRPLHARLPFGLLTGDDWFINLSAISDSLFEPRTFPIPVGVQTTQRPGSLDVFGHDASYVLSQTFLFGGSLIKGSTTFKPPEIEYRIVFGYNASYVDVPERRVLFVQPSKPTHRADHYLGLQEAFVDYHLFNHSERYDFVSVRAGIQPFQSDFRGFLFNDNQLGVRLFGNLDGNRVQFNLAAFRRLDKDTNSGLNAWTRTPRDDWVFVANLYRQDMIVPGLTGQITALWNRNREGDTVRIDDNGFPIVPALLGQLRGHDYDVLYLGANADGRFGRINLTAAFYGALGTDSASFLTGRRSDIRAGFAAAEASYDHDWIRVRLSGLYASGDSRPYDDRETGFDAILENPVFAGADTSYWIRQSIPFAGGGRAIALSGRNGILNSLRASKDQGQSNFINPGTVLVGVGGDFDLKPTLRLSVNANHLWFATTEVLEVLRNEGSIPRAIGYDLSAALVWRPKANQNIVARLSAAALLPGAGFRDLFTSQGGGGAYMSLLANLILSY